MTAPPLNESPANATPKFPPAGGAVKRLAIGAGTTFAAKVLNTGIKFLTQIVLCRLLGAAGFGLYALAIVVSQVAELFACMGLESGSVRFVSIHRSNGDPRRMKGILIKSVLVPLAGGVCFAIPLFIFAADLASQVFQKPELTRLLRIVAMGIPFGAVMTVLAFASTGFGVTHYLAAIWTFHPLANLLIAAALCFVGMGVAGATTAWAISGFAGAFIAFYCIRKAWPLILSPAVKPIYEFKRLLAFSLPLAMGNFLWLVLLWTDILALGYYSSAEDVGIYRATSQTSLLPTMIIVSINTIIAPTIADLLNRKQHDETRNIFQTSARWSLTATIPIFLLLAIPGGEVLRVFGVGFDAGATPLFLLALGQLVTAGTGSCGQVLVMSGHPYMKLVGDLTMAIANIVLNFFLIPRWGIMGAATATAISIAAVHILRVGQVWWLLKLSPYNGRFLKVLLAGALAGAAGMTLHSWATGWHYLVTLTAMGAAMTIVYLALLIIFGLEPEDRSILNGAIKKIRRGPWRC